MSLPLETMLELMALVDGELQGEAKERAESLAARDEEARRVVEALRAGGVRSWLNDTVEQQARAADGVADKVMARLEAGSRRGSGGPVRRGSRVMKAQTIVATALALAAGIAILVRSHQRASPAPVASVRVANPLTLAGSVEVDEIDSVAHVSIFAISPNGSSTARSSVVVWIDDESEDN